MPDNFIGQKEQTVYGHLVMIGARRFMIESVKRQTQAKSIPHIYLVLISSEMQGMASNIV